MTEVSALQQTNRKPVAIPSLPSETQKAMEPTSLSTITLYLRPAGDSLRPNPMTRAYEAGFETLRSSLGTGMASRDTGEAIATLRADSNGLARPIKEIALQIDPENCPIEWRAGSRLIGLLERYLILVDAAVYDGLGALLSPDELKAIGEHIDRTMFRRFEEVREASLITMPSGEIREPGDLSFQYAVRREAGSRVKVWRPVRFDCQPTHFYKGYVQGIEMAEEVIACFKKHKVSDFGLESTLDAAFQAGRGQDEDEGTKLGQVRGFMMVMCALIRVGAGHINPKWIEEKHRHAIETLEGNERHKAQKKAEFVDRMRQGRKAAADRRAKDNGQEP